MKQTEGYYCVKGGALLMSSNTCLSQVVSDLQSGVQSQVMLDVLSLAELQRLGVPHTDDSLKYQYRLEQDRYGTT